MAQLVARDIWDVDAAGSNPVTPTKFPLRPLTSEDFSLFNAVQILTFKVSKKRNGTSRFRTVPFVVYAVCIALSRSFSAAISARFMAIISSSLASHSS